MKKIVISLHIIGMFALILSGCGGTSSQKATTKTTQPVTSPPTVSEERSNVPRKFEVLDLTPRFFKDALALKRPIFVEFYAPWCGTCREMAPIIQKLQKKYGDRVAFVVLNIDETEKMANLAEQFDVRFLPHIAILDPEGTIVFEHTGYADEKFLEHAIYDVLHP